MENSGEVKEVKCATCGGIEVKCIGRDSAYEGKFNYVKDFLTVDELKQLETIAQKLRSEGHKYLVIDTADGEFVFSLYR